MKNAARVLIAVFALLTPSVAAAQSTDETRTLRYDSFRTPRLAVLAGLIQPIVLRGGNVEVDVHFKRFVVGYSHGFLLNIDGAAVVGEAGEQELSFHLPYSTGFGVGLRPLEWLDIRLEGKAHRFQVRQAGSDRGSPLFSYTTYTLGAGVYAQYRPFDHFGVRAAEWLRGFTLVNSLRWWPNVASTLPQNRRSYTHPTTGVRTVHHAQNIGIANTPIIYNLSIGYSFAFNGD